MEKIFWGTEGEIIGGLIIVVLVGLAGFLYGKSTEAERFIKLNAAAISSFSNSLGDAISNNTSSSSIVKAKRIVSIRDSTREQLDELSKLLNSDIDKLSSLLSRVNELRSRSENVPDDLIVQVNETLEVLTGTWPAKKSQIDGAIRKLLTELGLGEFK